MTDFMSDLALRLRSWTIDWNGEPMSRGEPPRDGLHCDDLIDAAREIERLRNQLTKAVDLLKAAYPLIPNSLYQATTKPAIKDFLSQI